jgi:[protein-PII] uridylyltransferase
MKPAFTSHQQLREHYQAEMAAMRQSFDRTGNGVLCIRRRALVVDSLLEPLWQFESGSALPAGLALVAVGGFGRKELFPSSDVDLLYLCADEKVEDRLRETIRGCNQAMWDLGLRASPMIRTLKECDRYDPDNIGPCTPPEIRQYHLPSRTQHQRVSGRPARSPVGPLAQPAAPCSRT